jgi:Uma2 family endonuclease
VRADIELDFTKDPPPDLAVEVDVSPADIGKPSLYAALGVPELWRYENRKLGVYRLTAERTYVPSAESLSLPGFPLKDAERIVRQLGTASDTALVKAFRERIR